MSFKNSDEMTDVSNQTIFDDDCPDYLDYVKHFKNVLDEYLTVYRDQTYQYFQGNAQQLAIIIFIYILFCICFYCIVTRTLPANSIGSIGSCKNTLFVTSHPDDECMFFGPTIVSLTETYGAGVYLLCLSRGNHNNLGRIRKDELYESCKILGIPECNVSIINSSVLPDDPEMTWNKVVVADIILNFVEQYSIDTIMTFDRYGVSSHPNHASVFNAVAHLCWEKKLPLRCTAYALESVSKLRKYTAWMDFPLSYLLSSLTFVVPKEKYNIIHEAMRAHASQYVWFRKLYMIFSRYVFINTFKEIDVLDLELEFELEGQTV